ncbi:MAG: hypothetical protein ACFFB0_14665 [Promethearchaeota archaeon]
MYHRTKFKLVLVPISNNIVVNILVEYLKVVIPSIQIRKGRSESAQIPYFKQFLTTVDSKWESASK